MSNETKLAMLRIQLYTAMQQLTGDELAQFWQLIDEISAIRPYRDVSGRGQLAIATAALRDLRDGIPASDFGHDIAHSALDKIDGAAAPEPKPALDDIAGVAAAIASQPEGQWMHIGFFGRIELEGYVTKITVAGQPVFHVDLPDKIWGGNPLAWEEYAVSALHNRHPLTGESVRKAWEADLERARRMAEQDAEWARQRQERALEAGSAEGDDDRDTEGDGDGEGLPW